MTLWDECIWWDKLYILLSNQAPMGITLTYLQYLGYSKTEDFQDRYLLHVYCHSCYDVNILVASFQSRLCTVDNVMHAYIFFF